MGLPKNKPPYPFSRTPRVSVEKREVFHKNHIEKVIYLTKLHYVPITINNRGYCFPVYFCWTIMSFTVLLSTMVTIANSPIRGIPCSHSHIFKSAMNYYNYSSNLK